MTRNPTALVTATPHVSPNEKRVDDTDNVLWPHPHQELIPVSHSLYACGCCERARRYNMKIAYLSFERHITSIMYKQFLLLGHTLLSGSVENSNWRAYFGKDHKHMFRTNPFLYRKTHLHVRGILCTSCAKLKINLKPAQREAILTITSLFFRPVQNMPHSSFLVNRKRPQNL